MRPGAAVCIRRRGPGERAAMLKNAITSPLSALLLTCTVAFSCGSSSEDMAGTEAMSASMNIVQTAVSAGDFKTLATALQAAGLDETLGGPGPFTVFAPTDAAFAQLPAGALNGLLADVPKLKQVLTYHGVAGEVPASEVVNMTTAPTVEGSEIRIRVDGGQVYVNDAKVIKTDIRCSNGIIHVIDKVIMPQ